MATSPRSADSAMRELPRKTRLSGRAHAPPAPGASCAPARPAAAKARTAEIVATLGIGSNINAKNGRRVGARRPSVPHWSGVVRRACQDPKLQLGPVGRDIHLDLVALRELAEEDLLGERILDVTLDGATERTGTVGLVVPVLHQEIRARIREPELQLFLGQTLPDVLQENLDDGRD